MTFNQVYWKRNIVNGTRWTNTNLLCWPDSTAIAFLRHGPLFSLGRGVLWFLGGRKFFQPSIECWQLFPSTPAVQTIFLKFPISHNIGGLCRQFFQIHLWGRQFISAFFSCRQLFSQSQYPPPPPRENNGPSLMKVWRNWALKMDDGLVMYKLTESNLIPKKPRWLYSPGPYSPEKQNSVWNYMARH